MNYRIRHSDYRRGIISVYKSENLASLSSLIDLKLEPEKYSIRIAIISSTMSNVFGNIFADPESEHSFIENLFERLEARKIAIPFRQTEMNSVEAIAY